jgi:hypothetical protein
MKVLELFAGSRSIGKMAERMGMEVFSSDINNFEDIHYVADILEFDVSKVPFKPDVIWASPPCTSFSVASIGRHWYLDQFNNPQPKTESAEFGKRLALKTIEIIEHFDPTYFFIENPRGMLRKMDFMNNKKFIRNSVTYCQYGDERMKPTDIWTNNIYWSPRPMCKNGDACHTSAPRGSRTGTQGLANAYERSKLPNLLCYEILKSCL